MSDAGLTKGVAFAFSDELSQASAIASIPEAERSPLERDYMKVVDLKTAACSMRVEPLASAATHARRQHFAQWLTGGIGTVNTHTEIPIIAKAASYVEHFTGARFVLTDPSTGRVLRQAQVEKRQRQAQSSGRPADELLRPAVRMHNNVDTSAYDSISVDELAVLLLVVRGVRLVGVWTCGYNLAMRLYGTEHVRDRVQKVLLPALAAMDVGEPHHMTAPQWETAWLETLSQDLLSAITMQPPTATAHLRSRDCLVRIAERLPELESQRPFSYRCPVLVWSALREHEKLVSAASTMAKLGEEQSNDYATALGSWVAAQTMPYRQPGWPSFAVGELRGVAEKARAATRRLKRAHLDSFLKLEAAAQMDDVTKLLANAASLSDSTMIRMREGSEASAAQEAAALQAAAAAKNERRCDGCKETFGKFLVCGGCRQRRYCSRACQAADWRSGHKEACKQLAEEAAKAKAEAG